MQIAAAKTLKPSSVHNDWLTKQEVRDLTVEKVVARLRATAELLREEAPKAEAQRFPTETAWSAVRRSGIFYLTVDQRHGGVGSQEVACFLDPVITIAESCMSTAWCAMQSMQHQWMVSLFPDRFQQEIFGTRPYLTSAGSAFPLGKAAKVDGGYRVNGHYRWGSGILYAQWVFAMAVVEVPGEAPRSCCFFMPVDEVEILDSWFVDGMAGSGSHDFVVRDVFVPEHRVLDGRLLGAGQQDKSNPLQRAPLPVLAQTFVPLPILGAARSVVGAYRDHLLADGVGIGSTGRRGNHMLLAEATTQVSLAETAIRDAARQIQEYLAAATPIPEHVRLSLRAQTSYAAHLCRQAARSISDIFGSNAHQLSHPVQRAVRDVNMLSSHSVIEFHSSMDFYGRLLSGQPVEYFRRI